MSIQYQNTPWGKQKATILNDDKLRLYGDQVEGNQPGRPPIMWIDTWNNYPRMMIDLRNGKDAKERRIELNLDLIAFNMLITMVEKSIRSQEPVLYRFEVKTRGWDRQNNRPGDPYVKASIIVGKDSDGLEFIGIQMKDKKYAFRFTEPEYHPVINTQTNQPATRKEVSSLIAIGWVRIMSQLVALVNAHTWSFEETQGAKMHRNQQEKNGGNNQNNGGYNNGNNYSNQNNNYNNNGGYNNNQNNGGNNYSNNQNQSSNNDSFADDFEQLPF